MRPLLRYMTIAALALQYAHAAAPVDGMGVMAGSQALLPAGEVIRQMGGDIIWTETTNQATLTLGSRVVRVTPYSTTATANGTAFHLEAAPVIHHGEMLVPGRGVFAALGAQVTWDASASMVSITHGPSGVASNWMVTEALLTATGDVDGDGRKETAYALDGHSQVWLVKDGRDIWQMDFAEAGLVVTVAALGMDDVTGDRRADIAVRVEATGANTGNAQYRFFMMSRSGIREACTHSGTAISVPVANGDGGLLVQHSGNKAPVLVVYYTTELVRLQEKSQYGATWYQWDGHALGEVRRKATARFYSFTDDRSRAEALKALGVRGLPLLQ